MASCHSLVWMEGKLLGDPLEMKMYESTGWIYESTKSNTSLPLDENLNLDIVATIQNDQRTSNTQVHIVCKFIVLFILNF